MPQSRHGVQQALDRHGMRDAQAGALNCLLGIPRCGDASGRKDCHKNREREPLGCLDAPRTRAGPRKGASFTAAAEAEVAAPPLPLRVSERELPDAEEPDMDRNELDPGEAIRRDPENSRAHPVTAELALQGATAQRVEEGALLRSNAQRRG